MAPNEVLQVEDDGLCGIDRGSEGPAQCLDVASERGAFEALAGDGQQTEPGRDPMPRTGWCEHEAAGRDEGSIL
ncbi:hypothetical protein GCM10010521_16130 [Streptomyces rameus]|uniref:Uncharacterized protein n=1 Tax=Streptomyces rameus TaxID=68261 RepID=A0ABP6N125_9ACTN